MIGTAFYVMEFVKGRTFWEPLLPQVAKADRRQVYFDACSALASLHQVDPERVGLADFGKPGNYIERQVSRWTKQYLASEVEHLPAAHALHELVAGAYPRADIEHHRSRRPPSGQYDLS